MIWDRVFWLWFALSFVFLLLILASDSSLQSIYLFMLLAGLGFLKLAEECHRKEKTISKKLLEKLGL